MSRRGENIYRRKDGRWEGRVLCPAGKYQYIYAKTYREVKEKKKALQASVDRCAAVPGRLPANAAETFAAWLGRDLADRVKLSTYESYYRCITGYVLPFYQERGCERISAETAGAFSARINQDSRLSVPYKRKLLTVYKTALRDILGTSAECAAALQAVSLPKAAGADVQVFSVREQRMIEAEIVGSGDRRLLGILLCFYTGIRLGEVCGLKWGDVDFDAGSMVVARTVARVKNFSRTGAKTILAVGTPKSACSARKIPLPGFLLEMAKKYKLDASDEKHFILSDGETPMEPREYQKLFQKVLERSGVKSRKFHAIRHTFATRALELGVDIKTLSELLGHSSVSVTLNIYAHSLFEQKRKAIEKLNAMYAARTETAAFAVAAPVATA